LVWPEENSSSAKKSGARKQNAKNGKKDQTASNSSSQKKNANNSGKGKAKAAVEDQPIFSQLDIRVGRSQHVLMFFCLKQHSFAPCRILRVWKHPDAESLYIEHIDLGEEQPRQVVSGLVKYVSQEQMINAQVLVICNLKRIPTFFVFHF